MFSIDIVNLYYWTACQYFEFEVIWFITFDTFYFFQVLFRGVREVHIFHNRRIVHGREETAE